LNGRRWEVLCCGTEARARASAAALSRIGRRAAVLGKSAPGDPALAGLLVQADVAYVAAMDDEDLPALARLAEQAGAAGTVLALDAEALAPDDAMALADIVFFDEAAFRCRFDAPPGPAALRRALALGPHTVMVTLEGGGVMAACAASFAQQPAMRPGRTAGSHAAFLDAWLDGVALDEALMRAGAPGGQSGAGGRLR
jgi:hypothetical protein